MTCTGQYSTAQWLGNNQFVNELAFIRRTLPKTGNGIMTHTAECNQVIHRIIGGMGCCSVPVNMMDMQLPLTPTQLAGKVVSQKGLVLWSAFALTVPSFVLLFTARRATLSVRIGSWAAAVDAKSRGFASVGRGSCGVFLKILGMILRCTFGTIRSAETANGFARRVLAAARAKSFFAAFLSKSRLKFGVLLAVLRRLSSSLAICHPKCSFTNRLAIVYTRTAAVPK